jgi:hypothetical protein
MESKNMRLLKSVQQKAKLSPTERKKIFKVLNFKNQTAYVKATGLKKEDAIKKAIKDYNDEIKIINNQIKKTRKENRALQQYGQRLEKTIKNKDTFTRNFKNDNQFNVMLNKIQKVKRKFLISWDGKFYALSDKKIDDLRQFYKENKTYFTEEKPQHESDEELIYKLKEKKIKFQFVEKWGKYVQDDGDFFDMHHKTPFDLTDFQIYTETKKENYENADACFIHALKVAGVEEKKLNIMRSMIRTKTLPKCMLGQLCEKVGIQVYIKMPTYVDGIKKNNITYGKEGEVYKLGLINEHYFLIKPLEITRYAVEHFDDEEFTKFDNWQKKLFRGGKYKQDKKEFIDSFTLIDTMYKNKERYLYPMTLTAEIYKTTLSNKFNIIENLEYDEDLIRENEPKEKKEIKIYSESKKLKELKQKLIKKEKLIQELQQNKEKEKLKEELKQKDELKIKIEKKEYSEKQECKVFVNEYFDFETTTDGKKHRPYLARVAGYDEIFINKNFDRKGYDKWIGYQMLKFLAEKNDYKNIRLYAHNGGYDIKFIFDFIKWEKIIERGHSLLRGYGKFYYESGKFVKVEVQDTKAYLACQLKDFKDMFKLDVKKEVIPYRMYNEKTMSNIDVWKKGLSIRKVKKYCMAEKVDFDEFMTNAEEWGCITDNHINIIEYSSRYCAMDCEVLKKGWETFRKWIDKITGLDIHDSISISSMVDNYFRDKGVYDGVYEVSSYVREFQQRCMVGGRTMTRENKKYNINKKDKIKKKLNQWLKKEIKDFKVDDVKLSDFDAVSLYPSAMARLGGYLKGKPKVITTTDYETLKTYDGYFVEIVVNEVNKKRAFPLMSYKNDEGIRNFSNDMEGKTLYVDKFMLEDIIQYHDIKFNIIRGYYYDEGRNMKLKQVIVQLFNERLKAKKDKNPIQVVYKLMMNAAYGKTLIKPFSEDVKIMNFKDAKTFITRQYNKINSIDILSTKSWDELEDFDKLKIKVEEPISEHFNNAPCGCEVLSMSKRIMNEVMNTAEDYDFKIYYQDTDSMHINEEDINKLALTYAMRYGRVLIGKGMGQFHSDFESDILKGDIYACESIFLGKKCYIDKLTDGETKDENGSLIYDYHIRMKGMNKRGIIHRADVDYGGDVMKVYEDLYEGKEIEFDLCGGGQMPTFDYQSNGTISSKMEFIRKIKF